MMTRELDKIHHSRESVKIVERYFLAFGEVSFGLTLSSNHLPIGIEKSPSKAPPRQSSIENAIGKSPGDKNVITRVAATTVAIPNIAVDKKEPMNADRLSREKFVPVNCRTDRKSANAEHPTIPPKILAKMPLSHFSGTVVSMGRGHCVKSSPL